MCVLYVAVIKDKYKSTSMCYGTVMKEICKATCLCCRKKSVDYMCCMKEKYTARCICYDTVTQL